MGIKHLSQVIGDEAPGAVKENQIKNYFGRKIAIDASMSMYQFLIAVRPGPDGSVLTSDAGETTRYMTILNQFSQHTFQDLNYLC